MTAQPSQPRSPSSDLRELVADSASGDRRATETLARWCLPRVRRTVLVACGGGPEADDVVQNVMAIVITKLHTFRGDASFFVWVDRITINEVRGQYRRERFKLVRLGELAKDPSQARPGSSLPSDEVARREVLERLSHHIRRLKPAWRLPIVLTLVHGYSVPEVAAMLEQGFEAVKKQVQRGKSELRDRLRRDPACVALLREWTP